MKNPIFLLLIMFAYFAGIHQVFAQENIQAKGLYVGFGLNGGQSTLNSESGFISKVTGSGYVGAEMELSYFFSPHFGIGITPGYSSIGSKVEGALSTMTTFSSEVSPYYLESNPSEFVPYILFASDSVTENVKLSYLDIPLVFKLRYGKGKTQGYVDLGGVWSYRLGDPDITGEADVEFQGLFTEQGVVLQNTGFGFENQTVVQATPYNPGIKNNLISVIGGAGILFAISPKMVFKTGLSYRRGITSIKESNPSSTPRREGESSYTSLLEGAGSLSPNIISLHAGLGFHLGGNTKVKTPKAPKRNKDDCDPQIIPLVINQIPDSRRNLWENDPEFDALAVYTRDRIEFLQEGVSLRFGGIEFCPLENPAEELQASLPNEEEGIKYDVVQSGYIPEAMHYLISLEPIKLPLSIEVVNEGTNFSLDGFQLEVTFQGQEIVPLQYLNSGDSIPLLYTHPSVTYRMSIETPYYKKAIINIDKTTLEKGKVRIEMQKTKKKRN